MPVEPSPEREDRAETVDAPLQTIVDSMRDCAIVMIDRGGRIQTWNAGARRLDGYDAAEVVGQPLAILYSIRDAASGRPGDLVAEAGRTGRAGDEGWRIRKDGSAYWAAVELSTVTSDDGTAIGFAMLTRDLTERRGAAESLRQSEERFRLLVDSVRDYAIFLLDPAGRVQTWNRGAELIKGYRADEIIGREITTFYTPEDRVAGRPARLLAAAARDGRVEDEGWRLRKDGARIWADVVITALRGPTGELIGFAKVTRDLSERRHREEQVRRSDERFRLVVEGIRDYAIFMLDLHGRVATWNAGAERLKGYRGEEIIGEHLSRFYPAAEVAAGKCELALELAARDGRFEDEGWRLRKDGSVLWANVVLTALRDGDGALVGYAKVTHDLTERRIADDERIRLERAQEAVRLRDEFLSIASHELRTPLAALQLQLDGLAELAPSLDDKLARRIDRALQGTARLTALVESLLDVSRLSASGLSLTTEVVDLAVLVGQHAAGLAAAAAAAGCELVVRTAGAVVGTWDPLRIGQVIANLLTNAIKYGAGTPVTVQVWAVGSDAILEVRDRGPGIADADLPRIFERFERAAPVRNYGGLGLGLYMTREIVVAHGGTVSAENDAGGGARFTVRLPRAAPETP
jgi:PAS domain S-box-containing protein